VLLEGCTSSRTSRRSLGRSIASRSILLLLSIFVPLPHGAAMQGGLICSSHPTHSPDIGGRQSKVACSSIVSAVSTETIASVRVTHPLILSHARHLALPGFQYGFLLGLCVSHCPQNNMLGFASSFSNLSRSRSLNGRLVIPIPISSMILPMDFFTH
jgi:hypothetical protein